MALHHAVLTLLLDGPSYGYELKAQFERSMGPQWGGINIGHVYQILDRLERDGLVEASTEPQPARPDRVVYEIAPAGREAVQEWLATGDRVGSGYRDDLFLKIMAVSRLGNRELFEQVMRTVRLDLLQELRDLAALRASEHAAPPLNGLLVSAAELQVRARVEIVEQAMAQVDALVEAAGAARSVGGTERADDTPAASAG